MRQGAHITIVNGVETSAINIADRGLAYGDGVFETIRLWKGRSPLLEYHRRRFSEGVSRLNLGDPEQLLARFDAEVESVCRQVVQSAHLQQAVLKIIVTRGVSGRGYVPAEDAACSFVCQVFEFPNWPRSHYDEGIGACVCRYPLSRQPYLAGIKHLNRLDQVMASRELDGLPEGVCLDLDGFVIEGTKSNILIFEDDKVITPTIDSSGIKGVLRQYLLEHAHDVGICLVEEKVPLSRLTVAHGVAMLNSVFGLWPVTKIDRQSYTIHNTTRQIQAYLHSQLAY